MARGRYDGGARGRARARAALKLAHASHNEHDYLRLTVHLHTNRTRRVVFANFRQLLLVHRTVRCWRFCEPQTRCSSGKTPVAVRRAPTARGCLRRIPEGMLAEIEHYDTSRAACS